MAITIPNELKKMARMEDSFIVQDIHLAYSSRTETETFREIAIRAWGAEFVGDGEVAYGVKTQIICEEPLIDEIREDVGELQEGVYAKFPEGWARFGNRGE